MNVHPESNWRAESGLSSLPVKGSKLLLATIFGPCVLIGELIFWWVTFALLRWLVGGTLVFIALARGALSVDGQLVTMVWLACCIALVLLLLREHTELKQRVRFSVTALALLGWYLAWIIPVPFG